MTDQLQERIDRLERENRRWRRIGLAFMTLFALGLTAGIITSITMAARARAQAVEAQMAHAEAMKTQAELAKKVLDLSIEKEVRSDPAVRAQERSVQAAEAELDRFRTFVKPGHAGILKAEMDVRAAKSMLAAARDMARRKAEARLHNSGRLEETNEARKSAQ